MTARAFLDRRVRRIMGTMCAGMAIFFLSIIVAIVTRNHDALLFFPFFVGFGVVLVTQLYAFYWGLRCPGCKGNMFGLIMYRGGFSLHSSIRFCPYCGINFDAVSVSQGVMQPTNQEIADAPAHPRTVHE